ncbi:MULTISPECIES: NUDIX hydrolase [unclassified Chelatococcus]|uniref:NUDIX hydrolase n=1 Tax=unclassified Chelatococcus TaxID=2638111 RepID=UPI001BCC8D5F|nr:MULTISPECIES: NUDIX hydrolase [unclassified Chelatococcus]MBS7698318.1 NUDIX hydrolase [Chelatococcus sp. YT9]MBX3559175.1 NUDIX hydrolase [Chelatococcus sp.]
MTASLGDPGSGRGNGRLYPAAPRLAASVAVFRGGKVLLASRRYPPMADVWSLPGGHVELGETLEAAALRELAEEVGITATILGFAGHAEVIERDSAGVKRHFVVAAFAASWLSGEAAAIAEVAAVEWVNPYDLGKRAVTPGLPDIVARAALIIERGAPLAARRDESL